MKIRMVDPMKIVSRIFYIIAVVSLAMGASFHGYRMHPEDVSKYNIGITMGVVMISVFAISLIVAVILTILARKAEKIMNTQILDTRKCNDTRKAGGMMKEYKFYGWQTADVPAVNEEYKKVKDPRHLYDLLSEIWCADTCAPRMRDGWSKENMTLGQCSITAFLAQDIFGGEVYGILRSGGNYHCYNVIGDYVFDLTSEQFGDEVLSYEDNPVQSREVHFAKEEKRLRYEYLREELKKLIKKIQ